MTILRELFNKALDDNKAWKAERLRGCKCPSAKQVNPKCPIHGVPEEKATKSSKEEL